MFNKVILIGRLGQNAEAKPLRTTGSTSSSTSQLRKAGRTTKANTKHAPNGIGSSPWSNLSKFAKTLQKGQLITLEGTLRYREVEDDVEGTRFKHRITEVHATSMKRSRRSKPLMIQQTEPTTSNRRLSGG